MDQGKSTALVVGLCEDELQECAVARNAALQWELDHAYFECLAGVGRPSGDLLAELSADNR